MKATLITLFIISMNICLSQSRYEIVQMGDNYTEQRLKSAFDNLDYCHMISETESGFINLDDGSVVRIKPLSEILANNADTEFQNGCLINKNNFDQYQWFITPEGILVRGYDSNNKIKK